MNIKIIINKIKRLGIILGTKKLIGYEAIFTWGYRKRILGTELYNKDGSNRKFYFAPHSEQFWYADPLLCEYQKKHVVFMECMDRRTNIGKIGYVDLEENDSEFKTPKIIIDEPFHLSFPTTFEWNESLYMLPETEMNNCVVLYKCISFPEQWEKVGEYLKGKKIVDSVVINITENYVEFLASEFLDTDPKKSRFCKYKLYKTDNKVEFEWLGAVSNRYTYESRAAGELIDNQLFCVQRSTPGIYGYSIKFFRWHNRLEGLEREILPKYIKGASRRLLGLHTYSRSLQYEVIDIEYLVFNKNKWKKR